MKLRKRTRLLFGKGINDSDYVTTVYYKNEAGETKRKLCPFHAKWTYLLTRCYYEKYLIKTPAYRGCEVCEEWLTFSNFKAWMETQNWQGKQLDKDILFPGNKVYGPDTCVFVDSRVNNFIIERNASRGLHPIGVSELGNKFVAQCWSVITRKHINLGLFFTADEAHQAWLAFKLEQAKVLASLQADQRVGDALIARYENYVKN